MDKSLSDKVIRLTNRHFRGAVELRRALHRIPETAWTEFKTSAQLRQELKRLKIPFRRIAGTGILAEIRNGTGRCVAIRTDIDGLPIFEQTDYSFKSLHSGQMHACGHDMHMATVTTTAAILMQLREEYRGTIKLIYQPAEESPPGGAHVLVGHGVLRDPKVEMIFGLHVDPHRRAGRIGIRSGTMCAGTLDFDITIRGTGGHGAYPHLTHDPISVAAQVVAGLQTIVAREVSPFEPAVVTVGKIEGGAARNVIPDVCRLEGTARSLTEKHLRFLARRIEAITVKTCKAHDCVADLKFTWGYPPLVNAEEANLVLRAAAQSLYGASVLSPVRTPSMGGEDFAHYVNAVPGAMFWLGVRNEAIGAIHGLHHPSFKADETALKTGISVMAKAALDFLNA